MEIIGLRFLIVYAIICWIIGIGAYILDKADGNYISPKLTCLVIVAPAVPVAMIFNFIIDGVMALYNKITMH